jgi:hypothetical protein
MGKITTTITTTTYCHIRCGFCEAYFSESVLGSVAGIKSHMKKAHHPGLAAVLEGKVAFSDMADPESWSKSGKQLSADECRASYVLADEPATVCAGTHKKYFPNAKSFVPP